MLPRSSTAWILGLLGLVLAGGTAWSPTVLGDAESAKSADATVVLDGVVDFWGDVIRDESKLELLDESLDRVLVLKGKDGRHWPILPTEAGLFFYKDERARKRPMRIRARVHGGSSLEVIDRYPLADGKPLESYYWCEICAIRMYHLKDCDCCQGPIELREHPVGEEFRLKGK
jgi:hypothetical protein